MNIKTLLNKTMAVAASLIIMATANLTAKTEAASADMTLPLPANGSYAVSVLDYYSNGVAHPSYVSEYIYGWGASGLRGTVMDIAAAKGTSVYSVADGYVYQNNNHKNGGYNVVIKHDDGTYSYYGHLLNRSSLKKGTRVYSGTYIGQVGMSGSATGYHLHFEWSGHDPYCEFRNMGYNLYTMNNSGASYNPHYHRENNTYTAYATGTDGALAINARKSSGCMIGRIPEGAPCTVDRSKSSSKWLYVTYNGVSGYSYYKYLSESAPYTYTGTIRGTDGRLAINSRPASGYCIATIPEGASCTVYGNIRKGNWVWVEYCGTYGYAYSKYIR